MELEDEANEYLRRAVASGRGTCATIVADTVEYLEAGDDLYPLVWQLAATAFAEHLAVQATWPARTDNDRLTDAFRALDMAGIVARQDFTCCQNCGVNEIGDEVRNPATARGYVFYHAQDVDRACDGEALWLAYGLFGQPPTAQIGEEVATALRAAGLPVDWDGSADKRIQVPLQWARRRHGRLAAHPVGDPAEPVASIRYTPAVGRLVPPMSAALLARLELPWLEEGSTVQVNDKAVRRERERLRDGDSRAVGRFDGLRLLEGDATGDVPAEPGLIEVTYCQYPNGPHQAKSRPMELPEILDRVRRLPTRTDSWLCAVVGDECVQLRWENGRLWLESPDPQRQASTGKYATIDETERVLMILATEHRQAVADLNGVTCTPW